MATSLPSPPPSPSARKSTPPPPSNADSPSDLTAKLDHLLANHLHLLDTYTTLRTQLSTDLSSAFFALASANRNAAALLGPGRQFGRDQYDERMKSTLQVEVEQKELIVRDDAVEEESEQEGKGPQAETQTKEQEQMKTQSQQDPNASTSQNESPKQSPPIPRHSTKHLYLNFTIAPASSTNPSSSQTSTTKKKTNTKPLKPLHQFHPLPPPSLRQTQSLFTESVSSTIPPLLTTMSQMKTVEREIWGVRREMGIAGEYESGSEIEAESEAEAKEDGEEEETEGDAASTEKERGEGATKKTRAKQKASSKSSVHNLVSRSRLSEPRSRVLKVD